MEIRIIELFNGQSNLDLANGFLDERVDNSYFAVLCYHNKGRTLVVVGVRTENISGIDGVKLVFCCILVVFRSRCPCEIGILRCSGLDSAALSDRVGIGRSNALISGRRPFRFLRCRLLGRRAALNERVALGGGKTSIFLRSDCGSKATCSSRWRPTCRGRGPLLPSVLPDARLGDNLHSSPVDRFSPSLAPTSVSRLIPRGHPMGLPQNRWRRRQRGHPSYRADTWQYLGIFESVSSVNMSCNSRGETSLPRSSGLAKSYRSIARYRPVVFDLCCSTVGSVLVPELKLVLLGSFPGVGTN